eukprot:c5724_g1_i1.p1 GENE.c5724_g1_i1~~c5724_g1_i1.p1  ORF type:complete len:590 (+),score=124.53 c5724_g1_i1:437-2206(+)
MAEEKEKQSQVMLDVMYSSMFVKRRVATFATSLFLRQALLYILYLVGFMYIAFPRFNDLVWNKTYSFNNLIQTNLIDRFENMATDEATVYSFLQNELPMFQSDEIFGDTHILGTVRLRQLRYVRSTDCINVNEINHWPYNCSTDSLYTKEMPQYTYGSKYSTKHDAWANSDDNGYIINLPSVDTDLATQMLTTMESESWISFERSKLFIDLSMYNPNMNLFGIVHMLIDRLPTGAVDKVAHVTTLSLLNDNDSDYVDRLPSVLTKVLFGILLTGLVWSELVDIIDFGPSRYIRRPWNLYDLGTAILVLVVFILEFRASHLIDDLGHMNANEHKFYDMGLVSRIISAERDLIALLVVVAFVRMLNYLKTVPLIGPTVIAIVDTMTHPSVLIFGLVLFIFICAFSFAYTVALGWSVKNVSTVAVAFQTLYTTAIGLDFQFDARMKANTISYILFFSFTIFNMLVLFNLLIAVISEVYPGKKHNSENNWRRMIYKAMESDLPHASAKDVQFKSRPMESEHKIVGTLRRGVQWPHEFVLRLYEKIWTLYPHDWRYGHYTEEPVYDNNSQDDSDDEGEKLTRRQRLRSFMENLI